MPEHILITLHHADSNSTLAALGAAHSICVRENCDAVICVPNKQQAPTIALNEVIPEADIKRMMKGEPLKIKGVNFWLESLATLRRSGRKGAIIALYTPLADMKKIEETNCKAIIFVPWMPDEKEQWRSQWNPALVPPEPEKKKSEGPAT